MILRPLVMSVVLTGCFATTAHRLDAPARLDGREGTLTVVTTRGDELSFQAPFEGRVAAGQLEVESPLLPRARFFASDVVRVETTTPSAARTGLLIGGTMVGGAALLAGCVALSVQASKPISLGRLPQLNGPLY